MLEIVLGTTVILEREHDRARALQKIRNDLHRCQVCADALTLPTVAIFVQQALDEIDALEFPVAGRLRPNRSDSA